MARWSGGKDIHHPLEFNQTEASGRAPHSRGAISRNVTGTRRRSSLRAQQPPGARKKSSRRTNKHQLYLRRNSREKPYYSIGIGCSVEPGKASKAILAVCHEGDTCIVHAFGEITIRTDVVLRSQTTEGVGIDGRSLGNGTAFSAVAPSERPVCDAHRSNIREVVSPPGPNSWPPNIPGAWSVPRALRLSI